MLGEIEDTSRAADVAKAIGTPAAQQEVDDEVPQHMEAASVIRFPFSQVGVDVSVAKNTGTSHIQTIETWERHRLWR